MLNNQIKKILKANPEYSAITPVIEKEILHHDILAVLIEEAVIQKLTFIGGTALRMCYNSSRLSEDLDFNGGSDFKPEQFDGLEFSIQKYIQNKYETEVWVNKPNQQVDGDTVSWKISIIKEANRPDLPRQKMHIDVCSIPSFDVIKKPVTNHYDIVVPTEGLLIPVQSLEEILADKLIAFAYRTRRIKPRDLWDIVWIRQKGISLIKDLVIKKLGARKKPVDEFINILKVQLEALLHRDEVKQDFYEEMSRFIPLPIKKRTLDNPDYWLYLQKEINQFVYEFMDLKPKQRFDMG